jgi:hypothetical protein
MSSPVLTTFPSSCELSHIDRKAGSLADFPRCVRFLTSEFAHTLSGALRAGGECAGMFHRALNPFAAAFAPSGHLSAPASSASPLAARGKYAACRPCLAHRSRPFSWRHFFHRRFAGFNPAFANLARHQRILRAQIV